MSRLLYIVGAVAAAVGVALIAFGSPDKEFSFGNTLIGSGVVAIVGGLIVIALGVVASQLQQLNEALTIRAPVRPRPVDLFEGNATRGPTARVAFPPRPKAEAELAEPLAAATRVDTAAPMNEPVDEQPPPPAFAPMLRNPEESPVRVEEEDVSLSPPHPPTPPARGPAAPSEPTAEAGPEGLGHHEPKLDAPWRAAPPPMRFDAMWPEPKPAPKSPPPAEPKPSPETKHEMPLRSEPESLSEGRASEPRSVAILKSGVVDGMGYTLYVDGSIEAELPQGTLRFASINELRAHLEKNS